jgi:hypothetical protein
MPSSRRTYQDTGCGDLQKANKSEEIEKKYKQPKNLE